MSDNCANCLAWLRDRSYVSRLPSYGKCRRHAPRVITRTTWNPDLRTEQESTVTEFPYTLEDEWCCEWEAQR